MRAETREVFEIRVNGREESVEAGTTVAALVARFARDARAVAVERNGDIVPRARHAATEVVAGDALEIVQFVQGG